MTGKRTLFHIPNNGHRCQNVMQSIVKFLGTRLGHGKLHRRLDEGHPVFDKPESRTPARNTRGRSTRQFRRHQGRRIMQIRERETDICLDDYFSPDAPAARVTPG